MLVGYTRPGKNRKGHGLPAATRVKHQNPNSACEHFRTILSLFAIWSALIVPASAQQVRAPTQLEAAINRAVEFLVSQQHSNGSIADRGHENAMTSLAIMALASVGHQPTDATPESTAMKKGLRFVLSSGRQDKEGYFGASDGSRMYGHGIVSLMLSEMIGMGGDDQTDDAIHEACQKSIDLIIRSQRVKKHAFARGKWRYTPDAVDSDLSITVWQLMALRSAKNGGLDVPSYTIDEAISYLVRSFTSPVDANGQPKQGINGFSYEANNDNPTFTMTAAGTTCQSTNDEPPFQPQVERESRS